MLVENSEKEEKTENETEKTENEAKTEKVEVNPETATKKLSFLKEVSQLVLGVVIGVFSVLVLLVFVLLVKKWCKKEVKPIADVELGIQKKGT